MMKYIEDKLERSIAELFSSQGYTCLNGHALKRNTVSDVLIYSDIFNYLNTRYSSFNITEMEIKKIINLLELHASSDLYESNNKILKIITNGILLKREDKKK